MRHRLIFALMAVLALLAFPVAVIAQPLKLDTSKVGNDAAASCYALLSVQAEKGEGYGYLNEVRAAYEAKVNAILKQMGQTITASAATSEGRAGLAKAWNKAVASDQAVDCWAEIDVGANAALSKPAVSDALRCWSVLANLDPNNPQVTFLKYDIAQAFVRDGMPFALFNQTFPLAVRSAKAQIAQAGIDPIKAKFGDCLKEVRKPLRKVAYDGPVVPVGNGSWTEMAKLKNQLIAFQRPPDPKALRQPEDLKPLAAMPTWTVKQSDWDQWIDTYPNSIAAGECAATYPSHGIPVSSTANATIADMAQTALALTLEVSDSETFYKLIAQIGSRLDRGLPISDLQAACKAWGREEIKRWGSDTLYIP